MKRVLKQWTAGLLAAVLILALLPAAAWAEEADGTTERSASEQVQALLDALPDAEAITADNRADVEAQLAAIDEAKLALVDAELDDLDTARYTAAVEALLALDDLAGADVPMPMDFLEDLPGAGTSEEEPHEISTKEQLAALSEYVSAGNNCENVYFKLTEDIDLGGEEWTPIGRYSTPFAGSFDGDGHAIRGLVIESNSDYQGLFGRIKGSGNIANLGVEGAINTEGGKSGGIVGWNEGTIENCYFIGTVTGLGGQQYGGIAGRNEGTIRNCYNAGTISNNGSSVQYFGGIAGVSKGPIQDCYNIGAVNGLTAGGIAGHCDSDIESGTIKSCYNAGKISGSYFGGIVGSSNGSTTENCYYLEGTADTGIGDNFRGDDKTESKSAADFKALAETLNGSGSSVWEDDPFLGRPVLKDNPDISGTGDADTPYLIPDKATLEAFRDYINTGHGEGEYFKLTNRINLGGEENPWKPIGDSNHYFNGTFDGNDFTISDLYVTPRSAGYYSGLFAFIDDSGTVKNLSVSGYVSGNTLAGGVAAYNFGTISDCNFDGAVTSDPSGRGTEVGGITGSNDGSINNCRNTGTVTNNFSDVGGIVGGNSGPVTNCSNSGDINGTGNDTLAGGIVGANTRSGTVTNCSNSGNVSATDYPSGIVSSNSGGTITNCSNTGSIVGTGNYPGGIVGSTSEGTITNCSNTGSIVGTGNYPGGIVGSTSEGTITNCSNTGSIVGTGDYPGGIVGDNSGGTITNCSNTGSIGGTGDYPGGIVGSTSDGTITNCYNIGSIGENGKYPGGIAGSTRESTITNCYNAGNISGSDPGGIIGYVFSGGEVTNCYYLYGSAASDVGYGEGEAAEKSSEEFSSGEVAWLLQNGQDEQVWGQTVGADYPELTAETDKKVYKVTFQANNAEHDVMYANPAGLAALPAAPALAGLAFDHWSTENSAAGERFDSTTPVTGDITLYAVGRSTFGGEAGEIALTTTYGTALTADLAQYVRYESAPETPAPGKFTYTITAGNETLGAETAGDLLTIPATANAGSYTLTIQAAETEPGYSLMSVGPYGIDPVTLTVKVTIAKADPTVTPPTANALTYTGAAQELVTAGSATGGEMQYGLDGTTYSAAIPTGTDAGAYTVWYKVAGDANHNDSAPQSVPVTIAKADPEVTAPTPKTLTYTGAAQELVEAGKTTGGTMQYSLDGAAYSAAIPTGTNAQTYTVWYQVTGDANHNDAAPQSVTVTIEKAEGRGRVTMEDYLCGQTDVDPVAQSDTNGTERVTYAYTMRGADDYRDTKPTTAGEYTVKAEFPATDNYNAVTATADFKVTHRLPADLDESAEFTCDCDSELRLKEEELTQVPPGLSGLYGDVETLTRALADQVDTGANYAVFDVKLEVKEGAGAWHDAPEDSVPASGLTVTLPYPAGTNARYTFTAVHMFASGPRAGETETPAVTNTDQGITFTVTGLSPVCIGWTAPASSASSSRRGNYSVTLPAKSTGGAVTADSASARRGSAVTLTVTPDAGYHLDTLAVTDRSGGAVALADNGDGTYTFSMPAGPVAVEAEFTACGSARFADLDAAAWYHDYTDYVIAHGLMQGVADATFAPDQSTTRAMVVTTLYRLAGEPGAPRNIAFADVTPSLWYTDAVSWAAANGIVEGYSQDAFGPNDAITREQMVTILRRYAAYKGADVSGQADLTGYTDASAVSDWAREGVTWAVQAGLLQGRSATTLVPGGTSTRAELAAVLARCAQAAEEADQTKA